MSFLIEKPVSSTYGYSFQPFIMKTFPPLFQPLGIFPSAFLASESLNLCAYGYVFLPMGSLMFEWLPCVFAALCFFPFNLTLTQSLSLIPLGRKKTVLLLSFERFPTRNRFEECRPFAKLSFLLCVQFSVLLSCCSYKRYF